MKVTLISVGTLSQKAYADAFSEYAKRFSAHGILECAEIREKKIDALLSMSPMTFPHQLARVMLAEQLYRASQILSGGKYHK